MIAQREFTRQLEYVDEMAGFFARRNAIWAGKRPGETTPEPKVLQEKPNRGINAGKDLPTLLREIRLPATSGIPQAYGKVEWTVRGIWQEYVGWFDENPVTMYPQPISALYPFQRFRRRNYNCNR